MLCLHSSDITWKTGSRAAGTAVKTCQSSGVLTRALLGITAEGKRRVLEASLISHWTWIHESGVGVIWLWNNVWQMLLVQRAIFKQFLQKATNLHQFSSKCRCVLHISKQILLNEHEISLSPPCITYSGYTVFHWFSQQTETWYDETICLRDGIHQHRKYWRQTKHLY
jgi:hypothetical protein